jgi:hypothetical protein
MEAYRALRHLVPDPDLIRRRAAGATLRELGLDYGVAHTTLGRYFARREISTQLKDATRLLRRQWQAEAARRKVERRLERQVRRQAKEQIALERTRRLEATRALVESADRRQRSPYEVWLDNRAARRPLIRTDLRSGNDELAGRVVTEGGGLQEIIEVTGLRTRENVLRLIDPVTLVEALDNEAAARAAAEPPQDRLRQLRPDSELLRRRAMGESLRRLGVDYGVAHTTLLRYLQRPEVARQLRQMRNNNRHSAP